MELLLAGMSGLCAWIIVMGADHKDPVVQSRVAAFRAQSAGDAHARLGAIHGLLARVGRKFPGTKGVQLQELMDSSGVGSFGVDVLRGAQLCAAGAGLALGLMAGVTAILVAPVGAWIGYRLPPILLRRRIARRREQAAMALPDSVDLLAVCTHAGLNLALSLKRVAARSRGVLGQELTRTLEEIELGVPRRIALQSLAKRNPDGDLEALVGVLENAERFGTEVSSSLESFSQEVRSRRRRSAEEQARRAPIKILFPLVFLILPAFVLLSVVPLMLSTFSSLGF
ncbi:MAG: type II secretion system F family protein [Actinomycetota bacterium]